VEEMSRQARWLSIGVGLLFILSIPLWVTSSFYLRLVNLSGITIIAVVGLNFLTGETGQISLGHAGLMGIGAYTAAILETAHHWEFWSGTLAAGVITTAIAIIIGYPTLRLKGHYLAIATLGLGQILWLIFSNWRSVTNGFDGIGQIPEPHIFGFSIANDFAFYYLITVFVAAFVYLAIRIKASSFGLAMIAVRDNEMAAEAMGISATTHKVLAFSLSGLYAGVAGSLYAHLFTYISPDAFTLDLSILFFAMLILGGLGSILGSMIAAVFLTLLPEWLRFLDQYYMVLYGAIIILVIVYMPQGIMGVLKDWRRWKLFRATQPSEPLHGG
jgi:branched-chain amino acid transport system permease protein